MEPTFERIERLSKELTEVTHERDDALDRIRALRQQLDHVEEELRKLRIWAAEIKARTVA